PGIEAVADHPVEGVVIPAVVGTRQAAGKQIAGGVVVVGGGVGAQLLGADLAAGVIGAGLAQAVAEAAAAEPAVGAPGHRTGQGLGAATDGGGDFTQPAHGIY